MQISSVELEEQLAKKVLRLHCWEFLEWQVYFCSCSVAVKSLVSTYLLIAWFKRIVERPVEFRDLDSGLTKFINPIDFLAVNKYVQYIGRM